MGHALQFLFLKPLFPHNPELLFSGMQSSRMRDSSVNKAQVIRGQVNCIAPLIPLSHTSATSRPSTARASELAGARALPIFRNSSLKSSYDQDFVLNAAGQGRSRCFAGCTAPISGTKEQNTERLMGHRNHQEPKLRRRPAPPALRRVHSSRLVPTGPGCALSYRHRSG